MLVDDTIGRVMPLLERDVAAQGTKVVAQMRHAAAGGLDS
jgi:hypothetical protein